MMKQVQRRAKQLYEMDQVLFEKIELPVFVPDVIVESQKALQKKSSSPGKKKGPPAHLAQVGDPSATDGAQAAGQSMGAAGASGKGSTSPARKFRAGGRAGHALATMASASQRPPMTQAQIDRQLQYLMLEPEDQKKDIYNSLTRLQNLMSLDVMYINKAELLAKKQHNQDL